MRALNRLSATFARGVKQPGIYADGGGLALQATATSDGGVTTSWLHRYSLNKQARYMGLGSTSIVSLAEARELAHENRRLLARGIDPISHRDAERMAARAAEMHTQTFKQCLDGFLTSHGDKWREKHLKQWQNSMETHAKPLFKINVAAIDVGMVLRCIEPQWKVVPVTMDRVRGRIGEVLGWAQTRGLRPPGPLPTDWKNHLDKTLPHPRELKPVEHHAAMHFDKVPGLFAKLIATDSIPELCLAFTILTAVRSQESRGAKWSEIDLKAKVWTVPPERMKRKRPHNVPLSPEALALLKRLPRNGEYLFTVNGNAKPIVAMSLRKALLRNGGDGVTTHGMRSSFRTWADEHTNHPRELKEVALSHAIGNQTEAAYARGDLLEKRRGLMQRWAIHCAAPTAPADRKVVALV